MSNEESSLNNSILERIINKVPGNPVQSKKEKQGYVNFDEITKRDILELIERQNKLLNNKSFLSKLSDRGERILNYKNQLEKELRKREKSEELSGLLAKLNVNGKEALDKLEWTRNCNPGQSKSDDILHLNNEFEETDPLKIIVDHSGTGFHKKITRVLPPEPSLIKPSDIEDMKVGRDKQKSPLCLTDYHETIRTDHEPVIEEPYIKNFCDKFDKLENSIKVKEKFLPHKSINRGVEEFLNNKKGKTRKHNWEVTAATPPPSVYNDIKLLPLETSVKLQIQQAEKLKEIQMKHASERLKSMIGRDIGFKELDNLSKSQFRDPKKHYDSDASTDDDYDDDDEMDKQSFHSCQDDEEDADERRGGITVYNLIDN